MSDYYKAIKVLKYVLIGDELLAAGKTLLAEVVLIVQNRHGIHRRYSITQMRAFVMVTRSEIGVLVG